MDKVGTGINWGNNWQMFAGGAVVVIGLPIVGILVGSATPNIIISGKKENSAGVVSYRTTDDIFSTTIHEIGHTSHIKTRKFSFFSVTKRIRESWANALEWYITKIEYNELGYPNYDDPNNVNYYSSDNQQAWKNARYRSDYSTLTSGEKKTIENYTPLFKDLVDNFNQALERGTPPSNRCPSGGFWDGNNCYIGTPPNGTAFIWANNFYYSGSNCSWPAHFDGSNCFYSGIPSNSIGVILANSWFLRPAGNSDYPYDEVTGYTMSQLESMLDHFNGVSSTHEKLKLHKPSGITNKHLDLYFNYFYNY